MKKELNLMKIDKHCKGCGSLLHTNSDDSLGYTKSLDFDYCVSCFKLKHYGKDTFAKHKLINFDIKSDSLVLVVYSVLNLDYLLIDNLRNLKDNLTYVLIINQMDLLNKDDQVKLVNNVTKTVRKERKEYSDIIFMSAENKSDINNLKQYLTNVSFENIYLYGAQNSGKTTILNGLTNEESLAGLKFGLTSNVIVKQFEGKSVYDLPGLIRRGSITEFVDYETYKNYLPKQKINPKVYVMSNSVYLNILDLIYIKPSSEGIIILYLSNYAKVERKNIRSYDNLLSDKLNYKQTFKTNEDIQIFLSDIGFIITKNIKNIEIITRKNLRINLIKRLL